MRRPLEIKADEASVRSVVSLTSALESLSSMQIAKTKNKVLISNQFFDEVWNIYKQIRVDVLFNFGRAPEEKPIDRELLILITAKGGLSGDIDQRLIRKVVDHYDETKNDVLVIGHHGALKLKQSHIDYTYYFDLPERDYINVDPLMDIIRKYSRSRIYYQNYISLSQQEIKDVDLSEVVSSKGRGYNHPLFRGTQWSHLDRAQSNVETLSFQGADRDYPYLYSDFGYWSVCGIFTIEAIAKRAGHKRGIIPTQNTEKVRR